MTDQNQLENAEYFEHLSCMITNDNNTLTSKMDKVYALKKECNVLSVLDLSLK
jgi:hypothetical protein